MRSWKIISDYVFLCVQGNVPKWNLSKGYIGGDEVSKEGIFNVSVDVLWFCREKWRLCKPRKLHLQSLH
jgi:hypothetical protein